METCSIQDLDDQTFGLNSELVYASPVDILWMI